MKANELMIGNHLSYNGQIIKVANITNKKVGYHVKDNECRMHYARLRECKPVPLTPAILEKNGFILKEKEYDVLYGINIAPYYTRDDVPFEIFCDGEPFAIWFSEPINIKYVHELQHTLRLCNIEKEIIL